MKDKRNNIWLLQILDEDKELFDLHLNDPLLYRVIESIMHGPELDKQEAFLILIKAGYKQKNDLQEMLLHKALREPIKVLCEGVDRCPFKENIGGNK